MRVLFFLESHRGFAVAAFDTFEAASVFADSHKPGPWYPGATWELVWTHGNGTSRWVKMLHDPEAGDVDYEGGEYAITSVAVHGSDDCAAYDAARDRAEMAFRDETIALKDALIARLSADVDRGRILLEAKNEELARLRLELSRRPS